VPEQRNFHFFHFQVVARTFDQSDSLVCHMKGVVFIINHVSTAQGWYHTNPIIELICVKHIFAFALSIEVNR